MKVRSTMTYNGEPIADCEWTLDDRARTTQKALAAMSVEDHLRAQLDIKHKIIDEEDEEKQSKKNDESESVNVEEETTDYIRHTHDESEDEDDTEDSTDSEDGQSFDSTLQDQEDEEHNGVDDWSTID